MGASETARDLLVRAREGDRVAIREILGLRRQKDMDLGYELCDLFRRMEWQLPTHIPWSCRVEGRLSAFGCVAEIRGIGVMLDEIKRWWLQAVLIVDGTPTAIIRRFGRYGTNPCENVVPTARLREWRRVRSMRGVEFDFAPKGTGSTIDFFHDDYDLEQKTLYCPPGIPVNKVLTDVLWGSWEDWTPGEVVAAHTLRLTRWGYGSWF